MLFTGRKKMKTKQEMVEIGNSLVEQFVLQCGAETATDLVECLIGLRLVLDNTVVEFGGEEALDLVNRSIERIRKK